MSTSTPILIRAQLNVINGFVEVPHSQKMRTKVTPTEAEAVIPGSATVKAGQVTDREMLTLPAFDRRGGYPADWFAELRDA